MGTEHKEKENWRKRRIRNLKRQKEKKIRDGKVWSRKRDRDEKGKGTRRREVELEGDWQ
jgi:hypothetical protein